ELAAHPLLRRLRRHSVRRAPPRRSTATAGGNRPGPAGTATVTGKDRRDPHRRGLRLPQLPHPPPAETRNPEALRLHHSIQESRPGDQGQGEDETYRSTRHLSLDEVITSLNRL